MIEYVLVMLIELHNFGQYSMTDGHLGLTRDECYDLAEEINMNSQSRRTAACIPIHKDTD
mgnify:CR=1 FL=1